MSWTPSPKANTDWTVRSTGSIRRIVEGAVRRRRLTEDGRVRIIERFEIRWSQSPIPPNPWHPT
jgi:hypothetical protein